MKYDDINLSLLPTKPSIIDEPDFEAILAEQKAHFAAAYADAREADPSLPAYDTLDMETDPVGIVLQATSMREMLLRIRINDAVRATMLAFAKGADLDAKGAEWGVARKVLDLGDNPPATIVYESDDDYRLRIQLAPEAYTNAGTAGAYIFHTLTSSGGALEPGLQVLDAAVFGPESGLSIDPGEVKVVILSRDEGGFVSLDLIEQTEAYLASRRPLTDSLTVVAATTTEFEIEAQITVGPGADAELVRQAAQEAVEAWCASRMKAGGLIGEAVRLGRITAALYVGDDSGRSPVIDTVITSPEEDMEPGLTAAAVCTGVTVTVVVDGGDG